GAQQLPFGRINAQAVIMGVADEQVAIAVDAQPAGPAVAIIGSRPGVTQVFAVAIIRLNACGPVDQVMVILRIDGHGAWFFEIAALDAAPAPDELGLVARSPATKAQEKWA